MLKFLQLASILLSLAVWVNSQDIPTFAALTNISYGSHPQQVMDVYLPGGRDGSVTKVIVLIHGGEWAAGKKEDMQSLGIWFYTSFPRHAIVTMGYRLASIASPAYPKQLEDISLVLKYITSKEAEYKIMPRFALVGASAGGHLAMLYAYAVDKSLQVNVVCNLVGPSDLTDPFYTQNPEFSERVKVVVGNYTFQNNPEIFAAASPVTHITRQSPKTISFYGGMDRVIPISQGERLEDRLDAAGVLNKVYFYPAEGHEFLNSSTIAHLLKKLGWFFKNYL